LKERKKEKVQSQNQSFEGSRNSRSPSPILQYFVSGKNFDLAAKITTNRINDRNNFRLLSLCRNKNQQQRCKAQKLELRTFPQFEKMLINGSAYCCADGRIEVSDEISQLPPPVQERLLRLQQLQQTLQSILGQKQQVELEVTEIDQALNELQKLTDDAVIYKAAGSLLLKSERSRVIIELTERKELLSTRATILVKQEERLRGQLKDVQTKLQQDLNPVSPPS
jgi:prefoldin beta subunit